MGGQVESGRGACGRGGGRSLKRTALVGLTLLVAAGGTVGVLVLLDVKISLYNMLVFPLAFGVGVDGAVYVIWASRDPRDESDDRALAVRAVLGSTLTDAAAFASLAVAAFPGLVTLAQVALSALGCTLVANLVWLPALLRAGEHAAAAGGRARWRDASGADSEPE